MCLGEVFVCFDEEYNLQVDIDIRFESEKTEKYNFPFNGSLAHAIGPYGDTPGYIHFNEDKVWTVDNSGKSNFCISFYIINELPVSYYMYYKYKLSIKFPTSEILHSFLFSKLTEI